MYRLKGWALVELLQILASFSIAVGGITWLMERQDRERERLYHSWAVLSAGLKDAANGARNEAMHDLAAHHFSMAGVQLPDSAMLEGIDLQGADLRWARMRFANLRGANFGCRGTTCSDLTGADLRGTDMQWAELGRAILSYANLQHANLAGVCLRGAELAATMFDSAFLPMADFSRTLINRSSFAEMGDVNGMGSFDHAHMLLDDAKNGAFISTARDHGARIYLPGDSDTMPRLHEADSAFRDYSQRRTWKREACQVRLKDRQSWLERSGHE